jgi:hypothetical protein
VERSSRSDRTERKKHPSSAPRIALRNPEPAHTAEPEPPIPAPAPSPPVARPPVIEPPPAAPPRTVPTPAVVRTPAPAAGPREPPVISATAVSKRSGAIPAIKVSGNIGDFADVVVKLCIDEQGAVSAVKVVKAPPEIAGELQQALRNWRYTPYVNPAGVQSAACFAVSFRVVLKN